jgi:hypothetical protein
MNPRVHILIPVHNRRAITFNCLRRLQAQGVSGWAELIVVDDGSTDGTGEAIQAEFPAVTVLRGNGQLYWTGAIELGMRHAFAEGAAFIFWLNDDCEPQPGALAALLAAAQRTGGVTGGVCLLPGSQFPVYGGFTKARFDLDFVSCAPGEELACDALNGNLVCVPRAIVEAVGFPDGRGLPHAFGDTDYTLRVRASGRTVTLIGMARATAAPQNPANYASWLVGDITVIQLWRNLFTVRSYAYFPAHFRFLRRHWGLAGAAWCGWLVLKRIPITLLKLVLPLRMRRALWSGKSRAWRYEQKIREESTHG